jgi:hypothetical protein
MASWALEERMDRFDERGGLGPERELLEPLRQRAR